MASLTDACEIRWVEELRNDAHTARAHFSNARVEPDPPIENTAHLFGGRYTIIHYTGVEKSWSRSMGGLRFHSLYKNKIWYITGKYLFCATHSERRSPATEMNVPQGK